MRERVGKSKSRHLGDSSDKPPKVRCRALSRWAHRQQQTLSRRKISPQRIRSGKSHGPTYGAREQLVAEIRANRPTGADDRFLIDHPSLDGVACRYQLEISPDHLFFVLRLLRYLRSPVPLHYTPPLSLDTTLGPFRPLPKWLLPKQPLSPNLSVCSMAERTSWTYGPSSRKLPRMGSSSKRAS